MSSRCIPEQITCIQEYLTELIHYLSDPVTRFLLSIHTIDSLTHNYFTLLPEEWLQSLKNFPPSTELFLDNWDLNNAQYSVQRSNWHSSFMAFLKSAHCLSLQRIPRQLIESQELLTQKGKKQHEIDNLLPFVAQLAEKHKLHNIIDIGSGKGYLAHELAINYNFHCLGLDSKLNNTLEALERYENMKNRTAAATGRPQNSMGSFLSVPAFINGSSQLQVLIQHAHTQAKKHLLREKKPENGERKGTKSLTTDRGATNSLNTKNQAKRTFNTLGSDCKCAENSENPLFGHKQLDKTAKKALRKAARHSKAATYEEVSLPDLGHNSETAEISPAWVNSGHLLVGLHSCGDLGATIIKLWLSEPSSRALVLISCCYNLLSEPFYTNNYYAGSLYHNFPDQTHTNRHLLGLTNPQTSEINGTSQKLMKNQEESKENEQKCTDFGFPLSNFVQKLGFLLGIKARKRLWRPLISQTVRKEEKLRYSHHRYRCLLQLLLKTQFPAIYCSKLATFGSAPDSYFAQKAKTNGNLSAEQSQSISNAQEFGEYVEFVLGQARTAGKLGEIQLSKQEISQFYAENEQKLAGVDILFSLQLLLASVVESLILADRAQFIEEQLNDCSVQLLPIFDAEISPRNVALIAVKHQQNSQIK
jgi:hypothetical protein